MGMLFGVAGRFDLPAATARRHRCRPCVPLDMGRTREATRKRSGSKVCRRMRTLVDERLQRLLGGVSLVSLRKRLRQRYERGAVDGGVARFRIANLGVDEHAALAALLGRSARFSSSMQVDVQTIDAALRQSGIAPSLRD